MHEVNMGIICQGGRYLWGQGRLGLRESSTFTEVQQEAKQACPRGGISGMQN